MRHAVNHHGVEAGITQYDFENAARRGIAAENGIDLLTDVSEHVPAVIIAYPLRPLYYAEGVRIIGITMVLAMAACSTAPDPKQSKKNGPPEAPGSAAAIGKHPLNKYVEIMGFRMAEQGAGKLKVTFAVVNHSEADIGDLGLKIRLTTTAAKPEDPAIAQFDAKVPSLGPQENKDVTVTVPTKLRIYELPDWQFLRGQFEITSPAP
jgi:hypothetical protein